MFKGILQQLRLTAFATTCRCHHLSPLPLAVIVKNLLDVLYLSACVAQAELTEEPRLQVVALLSTLLAKTTQRAFQLVDRTQCLLHLTSVILPQAMELRVLELPPSDIILIALPYPRPTGMTRFKVFDGLLLPGFHGFQPPMGITQILSLLHVANALIESRDPSLVRLEIAIGLKIVIDCGHKIGPVAASDNLSAVTGYVAQLTILPHDHYTKHLAFGNLSLKDSVYRALCKDLLFVTPQICRYLRYCEPTKRIRLIVERIVQPDRRLYGCIERMEDHSIVGEMSEERERKGKSEPTHKAGLSVKCIRWNSDNTLREEDQSE